MILFHKIECSEKKNKQSKHQCLENTTLPPTTPPIPKFPILFLKMQRKNNTTIGWIKCVNTTCRFPTKHSVLQTGQGRDT